MSEPFLSQVSIFGFNFPPRGWAQCDGQILPINQNQSLYSLLGTTYGGDGRTTFGLPGLRGRTPVHFGSGPFSPPLGQRSGAETVTLTTAQIPSHTHTVRAASDNADSNQPTPGGTKLLARAAVTMYHAPGTQVQMHSGAVGAVGSQAHNNMQPYLALNFCIAIQGLFPSRN